MLKKRTSITGVDIMQTVMDVLGILWTERDRLNSVIDSLDI